MRTKSALDVGCSNDILNNSFTSPSGLRRRIATAISSSCNDHAAAALQQGFSIAESSQIHQLRYRLVI
ncbi:MAG: hypothetical protein LBJ38_02285 [Oscillospiraceae bacterium]|nr:hypothetical protein [Oscillospiraceae bacterium]